MLCILFNLILPIFHEFSLQLFTCHVDVFQIVFPLLLLLLGCLPLSLVSLWRWLSCNLLLFFIHRFFLSSEFINSFWHFFHLLFIHIWLEFSNLELLLFWFSWPTGFMVALDARDCFRNLCLRSNLVCLRHRPHDAAKLGQVAHYCFLKINFLQVQSILNYFWSFRKKHLCFSVVLESHKRLCKEMIGNSICCQLFFSPQKSLLIHAFVAQLVDRHWFLVLAEQSVWLITA